MPSIPKEYQKHVGETPRLTNTVNHQDQLATIIAAHYSGARQAIMEWVRRRDQYMILFISAVSAILTYYVNKRCDALLLTIIPVLTVVIIFSYNSADIHIGYLSKWLKHEYSETLDEYSDVYKTLKLGRSHWDASDTLTEFYTSTQAAWRYVSLGLIFVLPNILTIIWCIDCGIMAAKLTFIASISAVFIACYSINKIYKNRKKLAIE